jgi:hypothetical protein
MLEVPMTAADASIELVRLIKYQISQALHVAAILGVVDRLKDGPNSCDFLAAACGAHPASLYRLLRALASVVPTRSPLSIVVGRPKPME